MTKNGIDLRQMSLGAEVEVGDLWRNVHPPEHVGHWAQTETDVVNIHGEYRGLATDPLGIDVPVGGEINTVPYVGSIRAGDNMRELLQWMQDTGPNPSYTSLNAAHVHVHIPGLRDDLTSLLKLARYVEDNWDALMHQYMDNYAPPKWTPESRVAHIIPLDGKRRVADWMWRNVHFFADSPAKFFEMFRKGKDGEKNYRPFRYGVHIYNLSLMDTVEFRCFRATLDPDIWADLFLFVERFMTEALTTQKPVESYRHLYQFPPFIEHDLEMLQAWERTRYSKDRHKNVPRRSYKEAQ